MQVIVNHSLQKAEAKQRLDKFADNLKQQFPNDAGHITQTWDGDTCTVAGKVRGFALDCKLHVANENVTAKGDLPFFAKPFQGMIETAVRDGIEKALKDESV